MTLPCLIPFFFDVYSQLFGSEDLIISSLLQNHVSEAKLYLEEQKRLYYRLSNYPWKIPVCI